MKKIRDLLPEYGQLWRGFLGRMFKLLGILSNLDIKAFGKNIQGLISRAKEIEEEGLKVMEGFPEVIQTLKNLEELLVKLVILLNIYV